MLPNRFSLEMLPPQAIQLAKEIVLIALTENTSADSRRLFEGRVPYGTVDVLTANGPMQLAVCRITEAERDDQLDEHTDDFEGMLVGFPLIVSDDILHLTTNLEKQSRVRLLSFLLGFCCKAFELGTDPTFARNCLSLIDLCETSRIQVAAIAFVSDSWTVVRGNLAADTAASMWGIGSRNVRRLSAFDVGEKGDLSVIESARADESIVVLSDQPSILGIDPVSTGIIDLLRDAQPGDHLRAATLHALLPNSPKLEAMLREQALLSPARVIRHMDFRRPLAGALEAAMSSGSGKIFLRGWLYDPHGLIQEIELIGIAGSTQIKLQDLHRFNRPDLEKQLATSGSPEPDSDLGFLAYIDDPTAGLSLQPTLKLKHKSGSMTLLRPALQAPKPTEALKAVLTSIRPNLATKWVLEDCIRPAATAFHRLCLLDRGSPEVLEIGDQISNPVTTIIIPIFMNLSFLKFQIAAFASDVSLKATQVIYVLDSPKQRDEVLHLLQGLHQMHGVPFLLVVSKRNVGYAAANNAGVARASGKFVLLLNSDVIPQNSEWLPSMIEALEDTNVGAVGPKLLFEDESIQHAGLYFDRDVYGTWLNSHYFKGLPRHWPNADSPREVPGVTGAALLVRKVDYEAVGGICEDYIVGDYEDSDFCLRIRQLGKSIVYVPEAELFHFERRSITSHASYSGTLACRLNQDLHHERWDTTITDLTAKLAGRSAKVGAL